MDRLGAKASIERPDTMDEFATEAGVGFATITDVRNGVPAGDRRRGRHEQFGSYE